MIENKCRFYCTVEISKYMINLMVGIYHNHKIKIVYVNHQLGVFLKEGILINGADTGKLIKKMIIDANQCLKVEIKKISLIIDSNKLLVKPVIKKINYKVPQHLYGDYLNSLINEIKVNTNFDNNKLPLNSKLFFVKPYEYIINDELHACDVPFNEIVNSLQINAMGYWTNDETINSLMSTLNILNLKITEIMPRQLALGFSIIPKHDLKNNFETNVIVEWNYDQISINFFKKLTLIKVIKLDFGLSKIIKSLQNIMICTEDKVVKYLKDFVNLNINKARPDLVIFSKSDVINNKQIEFSQSDLNEFVYASLLKDTDIITKTICSENFEYDSSSVLYSGDIISVAGFKNVVKQFKNSKVYYSKLIGADYQWCNSLIGNIYYQHLQSKNNYISNNYDENQSASSMYENDNFISNIKRKQFNSI